MTVGELLDAATTLLRTRAALLLGCGFLVALLEQVLLFWLRQTADIVFVVWPNEHRLDWYVVLLVTGFVTELVGIAVLGALAASAAPRALLGPSAPARPVPVWSAVTLTVLIGVVAAVGAISVFGGPVVYLLLGLAMPALVIDRVGPGRALLRSVRLSTRQVMRAAWVRLLGYVSWLLIRLATGTACWALLDRFVDTGTARGDHLVTGLAWLVVNSLAYPTLACLDVVLHLDLRMRTEGLDLTLRRSLSRRVSCERALAVPR